MINENSNPAHKAITKDDLLAHIRQMLNEIQYGSIEIVIHDGKVVQIERKEKLRP
ncbi:MAG: DUF2292 domain-containing protein [Methylobacter sp.]|nr:MAG: DUF2292 domain-containing protein [Methylobacter sp.]PPD02557.1 MAG: DUF2292 domain-containing protein [Methylobacter sp.]